MVRRAVLLASCFAAGATLLARPQTSFHAGVEIVPVYATVTDADGRLVPNLTKADFEIRDSGQRQPIALFSNDIQPITIIIMMDRSGSMMPRSDIVEHAAEEFVARLLPADRARIGDFSSAIRIHPSTFVSDPQALVHILRSDLQTDDNGPSPIWTALDRSVMAIAGEPGRRVVLAFTDGHDEPGPEQMHVDFKTLRQDALANEVMVYSIGVPAEVPTGPVAYFNGRTFGGGMKFEPPDKHLRQLADATGGGYLAFDWAQNLNTVFTQVADELHHQYLLGFTPRKLDGKTHTIALNVAGANLKVRARPSYVAAPRN